MSISLETYRRLKREVEEATAEAERAKGALDQLMDQMKKDFGCSNAAEAKTLLKSLSDQRDKANAKFEKALKEYEAKWKA